MRQTITKNEIARRQANLKREREEKKAKEEYNILVTKYRVGGMDLITAKQTANKVLRRRNQQK